MKQITAAEFQITSETVDGDHEDDWATLLKVLKKAVAIYDQADLKRRKRLRRPRVTNASTKNTSKTTPMDTLKAILRK